MRKGLRPRPLTLEAGCLYGSRYHYFPIRWEQAGLCQLWLTVSKGRFDLDQIPGKTVWTEHIIKSLCGSGLTVLLAGIKPDFFFMISHLSKCEYVVYKPLPKICYNI